MKIFLDTNVLVSAAATRGLCADVLREVLASHRLVVSKPLLDELKQALRLKLRVPGSLVDEFIAMLQQDAIVSTGAELIDISIQDMDDVVILSSALKGNADLFITGDKELLGLGKVEGMKIVSPRMFWTILKTRHSR